MSHDLKISARAEKTLAKIENKFTMQGGSKLEVFDDNGGKIYEGEFKSFTANFLKLLYGSMAGAGTEKAKDLSNTDVAMNDFPQCAMNLSGGASVKKFGVVVGTNTAAVSVSDYNVAVPASLTVNNTVVSASSVGADSISVEISRQISNTSGVAVSLKEAGLICGSEDEVDSNALIARDSLNMTLENGKKTTWRYTINFNFTNDKGGFVKTFADSMFNGVFREVTASAGWPSRRVFGCLVYDNKMWVMGGYSGSVLLNDVWFSSDGVTWTQATSSAGWTARSAFDCCVYDNKMWVMGGNTTNSVLSDVWYSTDGVNWTQATSSANWLSRRQHHCIVYNDKIWVIGGENFSGIKMNDVWFSSDGVTWTQATSSAGWTARNYFSCCVYDDKMWVMGGYSGSVLLNDVWFSSDGVTWTQATGNAVWGKRSAFYCCVFNNKMWVMGGYSGSVPLNDVWYSTDGVNWIMTKISAEWEARDSFNGCVYDGKMWIMGGWPETNPNYNDVWATKNFAAEIKPGTSDSAFSATATALGAEIADGSGSGQLVYGNMPDTSTKEPSVTGNKTKFSLAREFTNSSGADITIREVGLFSGTDMLARLILAQPVTIANGGSEIVTVDFETEV